MSQEAPIPPAPGFEAAQPNHAHPTVGCHRESCFCGCVDYKDDFYSEQIFTLASRVFIMEPTLCLIYILATYTKNPSRCTIILFHNLAIILPTFASFQLVSGKRLVDGYHIEVRDWTNELVHFDAVDISGGATRSHTLSDLRPNTRYSLFVLPLTRMPGLVANSNLLRLIFTIEQPCEKGVVYIRPGEIPKIFENCPLKPLNGEPNLGQ